MRTNDVLMVGHTKQTPGREQTVGVGSGVCTSKAIVVALATVGASVVKRARLACSQQQQLTIIIFAAVAAKMPAATITK